MRYLTYLSCSSLEQRYISWNSLCFKVKFTYPNIVIPILSVFCSFHFHPATPNEKSSTMFLKLPKNHDVSFFPPKLLTLSIIIIIIITIIIIVHCQWLPLLIFRVRAKACPAGNCQSRQGLVLASRLTHPAICLSLLIFVTTITILLPDNFCQEFTHSSVKFLGLKLRLCKKKRDKYKVWCIKINPILQSAFLNCN